MTELFLVIIIVVLVVLLSKKSQGDSDEASYYKGYSDGWNTLSAHIKELLHKGSPDANAIKAVIEGKPGFVQPVARRGAAQSASKRQVVDEEKRNLRNTNIVLYLASFLFVAAGAAFIAAAVDDAIKLFGVWLLVAAFYGAGLYMHSKIPKLRPAAIAFAGTGMALLPFAGVALHQYGGVSSEFAWLVTSVVGVLGYYWVAIRLSSIVVSYLTMAFVLSLVSSCVATASLPIVWGYTSIIIVSLVSNLLSYMHPSWLPKIFNEPVERTGQIVTPVALVASLFVYSDLSLSGYEIVFAVATAHYLVAWLQSHQYLYENAARVVGHMAALFFAWDISGNNYTAFGLWFLVLATAQLVYSLVRRREGYKIWLWVAMGLQFFANVYWFNDAHPMVLLSYGLAVLGVSSFAAAYLLRSVRLATVGLGVTVILPLVVMRGAIVPYLEWGWVVSWYLVAATAALFGYMQWVSKRSQNLKTFVASGFLMYTAMAAVLATMLSDGSGASAMAAVTALLFVASYVIAVPEIVFAAALTAVVAMVRLWHFNSWDTEWLPIGVSWVVCIMLFAVSWVMLALDDERRRPLVLYSAWVVAGFGALMTFFDGSNDSIALASAMLVVALGTSVVLEGRRSDRQAMIETGVYLAMAGAQRTVSVWYPDLNSVFYAHWWAAAIAAMAILKKQYLPRLMIAMGFITVITGSYALSNGDSYSLLFLAEHVALVLAGVYLNKNWAIWWGIIASSLAVLYFLRDIAFAAFGFLGLLLIGFVIWRLIRQDDNKKS